MSWTEFDRKMKEKREEHTVDPRYQACDDLMYTLRRLGYVDRVIRATLARELFILHKSGPEGLEEHRSAMFGDER